MPRRKPVQTLKELSLESILANMDSLWCKPFLSTLFQQKQKWPFVVGPFDALPTDLCHDILVAMKQRGKLRRHHYNLLLNPSFKTLDLSGERKDLKMALELTATRCTELRSLNLAGCMLWKSALEYNIPSFTRLTNLCLSNTNVTDEDLIVIGAYGYNLEEIDLMGTNIRMGLIHLVKDTQEPGAIQTGKCQRLRMINVDHCHVESTSVETVLLSLPNLLEIHFSDLIRIIFCILQKSPETTFNLVSIYASSDLHHDGPVMSDYILEAVLKSCPNAVKFDLRAYPTMSETSLLPLTSRKTPPRELSLRSGESDCEPLSCLNAMTPVLSVCTETLVSLNLMSVSDVNIPLIIELSPRLVHLVLLDVVSFTTVMPHDMKRNMHNYLMDLKTLKLWCKSDVQSPDEDTMVQLLKSPKLLTLDLLHCDSFNDACMERLREEMEDGGWRNSMTDLKSLSLRECHNISMDSLVDLALGENSLGHMALHHCQEITLCDVQRCRKIIARAKLLDAITIDWS